MMNQHNLPSTALLEEVFNELETQKTSNESNVTKSGFLEDVISLEKKFFWGKKKNKVLQETLKHQNLNEKVNSIHEGLTDSSEDEDNKYFEESKYSECGRLMRNLIKDRTSLEPGSAVCKTKEPGWNKSEEGKSKLKKQLERFEKTSNEKQYLVDPILGMCIINPLVSSLSLKEKLVGRVSVSILKLKSFLETPASKESNWVTGGAIVNKMTRTSQKGNQYCVWHLSDLKGDIKTICVFLFGSAYKEYWKTCLGSVVGILNPTVMDNKDGTEATLRVDNAQKVLLMGTSRDYGLCKSKKKNGENCLSVVNKSKCDYCVYHMKKEYNKACRRSDLQPPKIGRGLDNLRAKVLGKSQIFYNGKIFTGGGSVSHMKKLKRTEKDERRIKLLSEKVPMLLNKSQKEKDESILEKLNTTSEPVLGENKKSVSVPEPRFIDLGFTITKKERNAAKANALKYIREHGPIKNCSQEKTKRTPEQISSLKRKLEAQDEKEGKRVKKSETETINQKYLKNGITHEFVKLMNSSTHDKELLKAAEESETEKYFDKLETKEKIEKKMASTFKVECKAVRCLKCNYKSFSASDLCKKEKHPLKIVNAVKRFWKCGNCSGRTVCLELIPLHSCKVCGSSKWERSSMLPEKKDSGITVQKLSLRGDEEKFVGATICQANLNLLVPEEAS